MGGGFGGKIGVLPEEMLCVLLAQKLGKPVKWTETRSECMLTAHHARDQIQDLVMTAKKDGTITGFDVHLYADMGAYLGLVGPGVPILGAFMFNAIYKIPALKFTCSNVFTNKTLTDAYRGAGRPEATFAVERMLDELAVELGRDPMELREQNWIKHEEFPFTTVVGLTYDTGNYEQATQRAMELFDYAGLRREQEERRKNNDPAQLGIGISTFTEMCGLARPVCSARWTAAPAAGRPRASGCSPPARSRSPPVPPPTARATRRRSRRSSRTSWASRSRTSRSCTATPRWRRRASTPTARAPGRRRCRDRQRRGQGHREGEEDRRAPARASEDDLEFANGQFTVKGTDKGKAIQ